MVNKKQPATPDQTKSVANNNKKKQIKNKKKTQNNVAEVTDDAIVLPPVRRSDETLVQSQGTKWINKQRVMVVASRGITYRDRHLMINLKSMMPHCKSEPKIDTKNPQTALNELCEIRNCNKCIFFENRRRQDLYLWIANVPNGPTAKFLVENIHTMEELRLTGNSLKASRPLLSFDKVFDSGDPHLALLRELFVQVFGVPAGHPKSQPFYDHVYTFTVLDNRIWFRNYQLVDESGSLAEIGPRFTLNLIKIFDGSFGGPVLYSNAHYIPPNQYRMAVKRAAAEKYRERMDAKRQRILKKPESDEVYADVDKYDDVFETLPPLHK